jgi:hypothetical protein
LDLQLVFDLFPDELEQREPELDWQLGLRSQRVLLLKVQLVLELQLWMVPELNLWLVLLYFYLLQDHILIQIFFV